MAFSILTGSRLEEDFLIQSVDVGKTKKGTLYAKLTLRDKEEDIDCTWWNYVEEDEQLLRPGSVITVLGVMGEYNGKRQINMTSYLMCNRPSSDFLKSTEFDIEDLYREVEQTVAEFTEPLTKFVAEHILSDSKIVASFKKSPAATGMHNNWVGGLLEHVVSMLRIAKTVFSHYSEMYGEKLSRDKLLFGVIFHDIGKTVEYEQDDNSFDRTAMGFLTNHIVLGPAWVYQAAHLFPRDQLSEMGIEKYKVERAHLMHMIASHHGKTDWGSPVPPATLEAVVLHHIDNLDAKFMHAWAMMRDCRGRNKGAAMTDYSRTEGVKFVME